MSKDKVFLENIKIKSNELVDKIKELIDEGNARRAIIKKDGRVLLEVPLAVGVGGAAAAVLLAPMLAAIGALAALVTDVEVEIERDQPIAPTATEVDVTIIPPNDPTVPPTI